MSRVQYQQQLEDLRANVVAMSDLVCERLRDALTAYDERNESLAQTVIDGDDEINQLYLDLEGECIDLFALQQPVAGDLRFIASSFKIITDLERIADLAVNLAEYSLRADRNRYPEIDITGIGLETARLVEDAVDAYEQADAQATHEIAAIDDEIDDRCAQASQIVVKDLVTVEASSADERLLEDVSVLLLSIRDIERVGDHAVNIAARTLYMVDNDDALLY